MTSSVPFQVFSLYTHVKTTKDWALDRFTRESAALTLAAFRMVVGTSAGKNFRLTSPVPTDK